MKKADKLSLFFANEFPFNKEGLEEFTNAFNSLSYKKGDIILRNGAIENELRFLDKGIVREYYSTKDKEKNINFYTQEGFITDFFSFMHSSDTRKNQECLTDIEIRTLSKTDFLVFLDKYDCGKEFVNTIFQRVVAQKEAEEFNHFINTAEELYLDIMNSQPNWLLHIPQYHIASYLGITPETLSRIRKRIS
ncbi:Crp/Fnr family transcriptional regulator [Bernardetia sp.]|uniref:Crp/Fnr family transcriptional regulator n=1 Tax=Bernardetia sp. TaxID=1937974 RepID=UPI0025C3428F|nr:Crp/Fnr family transcriptional regulator [Bernardetia sp.]